MDNKIEILNNNQIKSNINTMINTISNLKLNIIKALIHRSSIPNNEYVGTQLYIDSFIDGWKDISNTLNISFKKINKIPDISCISYDTVRGYVNTSHDFASVLQFTNGVFTGINENKFVDKSDIDDFYNDVISKAFNNVPVTVGGLMDGMNQSYNNYHKATDEDIKVYNSSNNKKLFEDKNASQLRNSIKKVIEFLINKINSSEAFSGRMNLCTHAINKIFDFIIYSLALYAIRINIIGKYLNSFKLNEFIDIPIDERKLHSLNESAINSKNVFRILTDADDIITRDISNVTEYIKLFKKFIINLGAQKYFTKHIVDTFSNNRSLILNKEDYNDNSIITSIRDNDLFQFITNIYNYSSYRDNPFDINGYNDDSGINDALKVLSYGDGKGTSVSGTAKQDLINGIASYKLGDTNKDLCINARDLYIIIIALFRPIEEYINTNLKCSINNTSDEMILNDPRINISALKNNISIFNELYQDLSLALLAKGREIELKSNEIYNNSDDDNIIDSRLAKLNNKQEELSDVNLAFVGTSEDKEDINEFYLYPFKDELVIYNEFMKMNPLFKDDQFLFEDGNSLSKSVDDLWNMIKAFWQKVTNFFKNAQFTTAADWVAKYKGNIEALKPYMNGMVLDVINYKSTITLPDGFKEALANIGNIPDNAFTDKNVMEKWVQSLYPGNTYQYFKNKEPNYYTNMILFQDKNYTNDDFTKKTVKLENDGVSNMIDTWIDNIVNYNNIYREWMGLQRTVDDSMKKLNAKVKQYLSKEAQQNKPKEGMGNNNQTDQPNNTPTNDNTANNPPTPPEGTSEQNTGEVKNESVIFEADNGIKSGATSGGNSSSSSNTNNNTNKNSNNTSMVDEAINHAKLAITNIYTSIAGMIFGLMTNEYKYIKTAYTYAVKKKREEDSKSNTTDNNVSNNNSSV